jgi:caa(3)-type oxidase subunit IV
MHSDTAAVKKSIRTYLMIGAALFVFTVITVAANQVHLAVPLAITVGLIIASIKASMVAAVFMHLNHERKWIYGSLLLTVVFFIVLMALPIFTTMDTIGTSTEHALSPAAAAGAAGADEHAGH